MTTNSDIVPKSAKRPQPKGGSRKGIPNKTTQTAKKRLRRLLTDWVERIGLSSGRRKTHLTKRHSGRQFTQSSSRYRCMALVRMASM